MSTIQVQTIGERAVLPRTDLDKIIELARRSEPLDIQFAEDDLLPGAMARMAAQGGAFDFWYDEAEDVYTEEDGEPL
jgi:cobyrinic acid a,c-diamide synthase